MRWPLYSAQSQVYIQPVSPRVIDNGNASRWPTDQPSYDSFIHQQVQSASYPDVVSRRLHTGSLQAHGKGRARAIRPLSSGFGIRVEVARMGTSYEVTVTAKARSAALLRRLRMPWPRPWSRASRRGEAGDPERLAILREEQERIKKELETDRAEQASLNARLGVAAVSTVPNHYDEEIASIHGALVTARTARDDAEAHLIAMGADKDESSKALDAEADELVTADPGLVSMKTSLNQRRAILISQMSNLTPNHPQYKQDATELGQIDASLASMVKDLRGKAAGRIQQKLRADLDRTAGVEDRLNAQLGLMSAAAPARHPGCSGPTTWQPTLPACRPVRPAWMTNCTTCFCKTACPALRIWLCRGHASAAAQLRNLFRSGHCPFQCVGCCWLCWRHWLPTTLTPKFTSRPISSARWASR